MAIPGMEKVKSIGTWAGRGWEKRELPEALVGEAEPKQSIPRESIPRSRQRSLISSRLQGKTKNRSARSAGNKHTLHRESRSRDVPEAAWLQKFIQNSPFFLPFSAGGTLGKEEFEDNTGRGRNDREVSVIPKHFQLFKWDLWCCGEHEHSHTLEYPGVTECLGTVAVN